MYRTLNNLSQFRQRRRAAVQQHPSPLLQSANREKPAPKILNLEVTDMDTTLLKSLPKFGPLYCEDEPLFLSMKKEAWKLVQESGTDGDVSATNDTYFSAMGKIEQDARNRYTGRADHLTGSEFRWMMIEDGCFFLHLALLFLGASQHLGYPDGNGIFGRQRSHGDIKRWREAMLFVGNQIPLIVLKELMKQRFFQKVVENQGKWEEPRGIFRKALYQLLGLPPAKQVGTTENCFGEKTTDLLHGLQCLVLGSLPKPEINDVDLESGGQGIVEIDDEQGFLSATEMEQVGIVFKRGHGGIKDIKFSTNIFGASLSLPVLLVDDDMELVFKSLIDYESLQESSINNKWEISSYLRLMKGLVRSTQDIKLLEKRGIISSCDLKLKDKLPVILGNLQKDCKGYITPELDTVRLLTRHHSSPAVWGKLKNFLAIIISFLVSFAFVFVLTFLQTFYTIFEHYNQQGSDNAPPPTPSQN